MMNHITDHLKKHLGSSFEVFASKRLTGGDINDVFQLNTSEGRFCIKVNSATEFPEMFQKEANGLDLLRNNSSFSIPEVIVVDSTQNDSYLLMSYIEEGNKSDDFWDQFGRQLSELHNATQKSFGLDESNYIGSLPQSNKPQNNWADFYASERISPQLYLAHQNGLIDSKLVQSGEQLCLKLSEIFPNEAPSLLHGDLWSGNYMVDINGNPALIDPAVYFGHREMDLAMTQLFGGFSPKMYDSYHSHTPLESNWKERIELCQLYPILVHVNLFGGSYVQQATNIIQKYI
jgi:fructosamine-3-kinase